jgi:hypothetical protein
MNVGAVGAQVLGSPSQTSGIASPLPLLSQPGFLTGDPFAAYLLSLSDAAAQALAAVDGRDAAAPDAANAALAAAARTAIAAKAAAAAAASAAAHPASAGPAAASPAPASANPASQAAAAASPVQGALAGSATGLDASTEPGPEAAGQGAASAPASTLATEPAADVAAAAGAAASAGGPAAQDAGTLGTDATAKYLGGGFLGLASGLRPALAKDQETIPAVNGIASVPALATSTSGNSGARTFTRSSGRPPATLPVVPPAGAGEGPKLDFIA